jgi:hypothetical protein
VSAATARRPAQATDRSSDLLLEAFARELASPATPPAESWRPWVVRLSAGEFEPFAILCQDHGITLVDPIDRQLADLAAVRMPSSDRAARRRFVRDTLDEHGGRGSYGRTEWMGGWDRISEESRRSLEQIGTALCGYPQLASEARFAVGQIGHVARRLLLGERLAPFVGHLDLTELLLTDQGTRPSDSAAGA